MRGGEVFFRFLVFMVEGGFWGVRFLVFLGECVFIGENIFG